MNVSNNHNKEPIDPGSHLICRFLDTLIGLRIIDVDTVLDAYDIMRKIWI